MGYKAANSRQLQVCLRVFKMICELHNSHLQCCCEYYCCVGVEKCTETKRVSLNPHVNKCWVWIMSGKLVLVVPQHSHTQTHVAFAYMSASSQEGDIIHFSAKYVHGFITKMSHIWLWAIFWGKIHLAATPRKNHAATDEYLFNKVILNFWGHTHTRARANGFQTFLSCC